MDRGRDCCHRSRRRSLDGAGVAGKVPTVVVSLDVADLTEPERRQKVLQLRRRVQKLTALLRFRSIEFSELEIVVLRHELAVLRRPS